MIPRLDFAFAASFFTYPQGNQKGKFIDTFISDPPRFITTDVAVHIATAAETQLPRLYNTNQLQWDQSQRSYIFPVLNY